MATLTLLQDAVQDVVQDTSYTDAKILALLNRAMDLIAGGVRKPNGALSYPLPLLYNIDTVETSTSNPYVTMPSDYMRDCVLALDEDEKEIEIFTTMTEFTNHYRLMDDAGDLEACVVVGNTLYYQKTPASAETVTLHYFRKPVAMAEASDTPDGIPAHLHYELLVPWCAYKIFQQVEDGVEGRKVNSEFYLNEFFLAMETLERFYPIEGEDLVMTTRRY